MQTLPLTPSVPHYRFGTTLDGIQLTFELRWNGRAASWFMSIFDEDDEPIRSGIRVVLGPELGGRVSDARMPPGQLFAIDLDNSGVEPGLDDLGERVLVMYISQGDAAALAEVDS